MTLYEIELEIMNCIDLETGEIIDTERLNDLNIQRDLKIENVACWIKNLKAEMEALRNEEKHLVERRKSSERKIENLKSYLLDALAGSNFKTTKCEVKQTKGTAVLITDESLLDDSLMRFKAEPDKAKIKNILKSGEKVEGAELQETSNITIK